MAKLSIVKGATSKLVDIFIQDSSSTTGAGLTGLVFNSASLTGYYYREGAGSPVSITLATMTLGTWATGGFVVVDGANMPGLYQLSIPDAALASGANSVVIMLKGATNMAPLLLEIELTAIDNQSSTAFMASVASVVGSVGSVTGNVGGNVTGTVGSVVGAVGSVTGNVGGNVTGTVASVVGNVGGNVTGTVASVVGNVGGNVTGTVGSVVGAVGSVTGNVGGNVTGTVASVVGAVGSVTGNVGGNVTGTVASVVGNVGGNVTGSVGSVTAGVTLAASQIAVKKNTALNSFMFLMVSSVDHITPVSGLTVTATRSINGGAFGPCANSAASLASGIYTLNLAAADLNGNVITFLFTATGADARYVTVITQA